jgi:SAM-dependent MidA family methyltransferase
MMSQVEKMIRQEIKRVGAISFARFMDRALYCPISGYYNHRNGVIGKEGDYITSVSIGPLFGHLLAFQFARWLEQITDHPLLLVEAGAHDGRLARDILQYLHRHESCLWERLEYCIVEPSPTRRAWQEALLASFQPKVKWIESLCPRLIDPIYGIVFSNELLDAMPVHRLGWNAGRRQWFEWGVQLEKDQFVWCPLDVPTPGFDFEFELARAGFSIPREIKDVLPNGYVLELCPASIEWWIQAARVLTEGWLLTIDYGMLARDWIVPERTDGTLRAYYQHGVHSDLLSQPGQRDLTAHVNFTALQMAGEAHRLQTEAFRTQSSFLTHIAQLMWQGPFPLSGWTSRVKRQFLALTHPEQLGRSFKVFIQRRSRCP